MKLYTSELKDKYLKKIKLNTIIVSISSLIVILLTTLGLIFLNENNKLLLEILIITIDIILLFLIIYVSTECLFKAVIYYKHIKTMLSSNSEEINCNIINISKKTITLGNLTKSYELDVSLKDNNKIKIYLSDLFDITDFKLANNYTFKLTSNYIVEIVTDEK